MLNLLIVGLGLLVTAGPEQSTEDRDAQPSYRVPPMVADFAPCITSDEWREVTVWLTFDVSKEGVPENIRVLESDDPCFNQSAINAAGQWRYAPKYKDGEKIERIGVRTSILYQIGEKLAE